jgi:Mg/Co/Ni transporter MgtE
MKQIFTKTQAVTVLIQLKERREIDLFEAVDMKHSLFKQSCDDLEKKLLEHLDSDGVAGVVED